MSKRFWTAGDRVHPVMVWSMTESAPMDRLFARYRGREEEIIREAFCEAYDEQLLKLAVDADVKDGIHDFILGEGERYHGIVVKDGRFEPVATAHAIYLAQHSYYGDGRFDHVYIERLTWTKAGFEVSLGS